MWAYVGRLARYLDIWFKTQAGASGPLILPCVQKKLKNQLAQFSESSLLVATSNNQYFEEITLCEWFDVICSQKCVSCIASRLRARQNGTMVCLTVKKRDLCSFSTFWSLSLLRTTPELVGS